MPPGCGYVSEVGIDILVAVVMRRRKLGEMLEDIEIEKMEARLVELNSLLKELGDIRYERDTLIKQIQAYKLWAHRLKPNQQLTITEDFMQLSHIKKNGADFFCLGATITLVSMTNTQLCMVRNERADSSSIPVLLVKEMADEYRRRNHRSHIEIEPMIEAPIRRRK